MSLMTDRMRLGARLFFVEAVRALGRHKGRSGLTALGVTIGVARAGIGAGATPSLRRKRKRPGLSGPGANLISIQ